MVYFQTLYYRKIYKKNKDSLSITLWRELAGWGNTLKLYKGNNTKLWENKGGGTKQKKKGGVWGQFALEQI